MGDSAFGGKYDKP